MASQTDIANLALSFLGAGTITALSDNTTAARVLTSEYAFVRDSELKKHTWRFSIARANLAALASAPTNGPFSQQFQLPVDCLKVLMVGAAYPPADLSDYRTAPNDASYLIEGNVILCDYGAPLPIRYVSQVTNEGQFDSQFVVAFAAMLAWKCCERITQSADKRRLAIMEYDEAIKGAARANAIEKPPEFPADDSWVLARMQ